MNEEILLLGKNNPDVVPELSIWGFPISLYLFLGGMSAGILIITAASFLYKGEKNMISSYSTASKIAFWSLIAGSGALLFDLHRIITVWRLFTHFDLQAPMSWGAWTLLSILPLSFLWACPFNIHMARKWKIKSWIDEFAASYRRIVAYALIILGLILAIYTGMLLSAFQARPLWDSKLLPLLFLFSGLSSGAAILIWLAGDTGLRERIRKFDIAIILFELFLLVIYIIDLNAGSQAQVAAAGELITGRFAIYFWVLVVFIGLVIPVIMEWRELRGLRIPLYAVPVLILLGGLAFRVLIVEAGQILLS